MLKGFDRISFVIVLFLVLVLVGCTGGGGSSTYTVTGKVTDSKDKPLAGIEIVATGGKSTKVTTKEDGTFNLALKGTCTIKPASSKYDFTPQEIKVSGKKDGLLFKAKVDESSGLGFEFNKSTGTITGYTGSETDLVIPAKIDGVDVKVIGVTAFQSENLSSVVIPSSVTSIEADAFSDNDLTSLKIPNSVTIIGGFAFDSNKLTQVTIPDSVTAMGVGAFNNNKLPEDQAFIYARNADGSVDETIVVSYGGAKKDNVQIPSSVTTIGGYAFSYNDLTSILIPNSVTTIEEYAFYKNKLTEVTIPGSVTSLGVDAFKNNGSISNSENIPTSDFVGTWTLFGAKWYMSV